MEFESRSAQGESYRLGRKLKWDPVKEQILGDPEATKMLSRPYRARWKLG